MPVDKCALQQGRGRAEGYRSGDIKMPKEYCGAVLLGPGAQDQPSGLGDVDGQAGDEL